MLLLSSASFFWKLTFQKIPSGTKILDPDQDRCSVALSMERVHLHVIMLICVNFLSLKSQRLKYIIVSLLCNQCS